MKIYNLIFLLFCFNIVYSQAPSIEWQKCFGGPGGEMAKRIRPTNDGGSIVCGSTRFSGGLPGDVTTSYGGIDVWVVKLDASGNMQWEKTLGSGFDEDPNAIQQTFDGGYIIGATGGSINSDVPSNHTGSEYWIIKLTSTGDVAWRRTYGGNAQDQLWDIQQTVDGGYIATGETLSTDGDVTGNHGSWDGWLIKLDHLGNLVWQKTLGGSDFDIASYIKQTADDGFIIAGVSNSIDADVTNTYNASSVWLVKLDSNGNIIWQKTYGSSFGVEGPFGICITSDGGYAFVSGSYGIGGDITMQHGAEDLWVVKVDNAGNILWQQSMGGSLYEVPKSIYATDDGGVVATGYTASSDGDVTGFHGATDIFITKLSSSGVLQWTKTLGGNGHDRPFSIYQTTGNSYMVAGSTTSNNNGDVGNNHGQDDFWVVKLSFDVTPVTLNYFNAYPVSQDVLCEWKTMQEQNSGQFIVERSKDGLGYLPAATMAAPGNSSVPVYYHFIDKNALYNADDYLYYRLKMIDLDGNYKYSNTVKVASNHSTAIHIYPNPVIGLLTADFISMFKEEAMASVTDAAGKILFQKNISIKKGRNIIPLNTGSLPGGSYILSVKGSNNFSSGFIKLNK